MLHFTFTEYLRAFNRFVDIRHMANYLNEMTQNNSLELLQLKCDRKSRKRGWGDSARQRGEKGRLANEAKKNNQIY